ncbi:SusC/RagA family TonB-linked outer membrane protein [Dyadobacter psychrotolerans]|uniref:SusC/RagA family TonB-linked outer membrane protein n=1 Tax=Dyadobacter psychrotolerans TaxID=2541721 RepID=A0A4R5DD43_9BACT|nr:SusC/RagA family TonB-linked outer membrane protein [Dyadobacter psychrotolerans]TDE09564.1 SusC/RagA family TonB-linked outer membrane protein [Dyadobacter psychrotolerans]
MKTYYYLLWLLVFPVIGFGQSVTVRGKIISADTQIPLVGASVVHKSSHTGVSADSSGAFTMDLPAADPIVIVSFIGYTKKEIIMSAGQQVEIRLEPDQNQLGEVIVSSGYQQIPRERSTGSFVHVDNELLNRRVSTDVLSRLADVAPGLIFNRSGASKSGAQSAISIRGQSTLFAKEDPLIVVDNFPYTGDLGLINPNDVESITILKDAAAASIWGAQSGNGVIVITTKTGRFNQPVQVSFNSNITTGKRPDLYYLPVISSSDYIDIEQMLFSRGYYRSIENADAKTALTPVVELLIENRDGKITDQQLQNGIEAFKGRDVRSDLNKYLYRNSLSQQYSLSIKGGSANQRYFASAGFDKNLSTSVGNGVGRVTLNVNNTYALLKQKLEISTAIYYTSSKTDQNAINTSDLNLSAGNPIFPYARLADENGNAVSLPHLYRDKFIAESMGKGLLDWRYSPQQELRLGDNSISNAEYRINLNTQYKILPGLNAQVLYQYVSNNTERKDRQDKDSWYVRDLINRFSSVGADGAVIRPVPAGDILNLSSVSSASHNLRAQLNFSKDWKGISSLSMLAGAEVRQLNTMGNGSILYGYDDELATSVMVDYLANYTAFVNPTSKSNRIPYTASLSDLTDRYISYYANGAYTFKNRYTLSASSRLDQSNLFGVKTNQKGVPLYSTGLSWMISREGFYDVDWLAYLNLRMTYGYNGNIDKSLSAYTTAYYTEGIRSATGLPYATIANPPNPQLRWERTRMINFAVDFKTRNNIISGSFEYYLKKGLDLIGNAAFAPQTGISSFRGNTANSKGHGIDLNLHSRNLNGSLGWQTDFFLSYAADQVTKYLLKPTSIAGSYLGGSNLVPTEGKPLYAVYSYRWAGLDPANGDPIGYLNDETSKDYAAIKSATTLDQLNFHGTMRPLIFGAMRNTITFKQLSVSANISYRLGYYVRLPSVNYATILSGQGGHADYNKRWQNPGDELRTNVPSMPTTINVLRNEIYAYSSALVQKGDHVRLQDINVAYTLSKARFKNFPFQSAQIYLYANNLGLIYKKAKMDLDPDYILSPPAPKTLSAGVKVDF